MYDKQARQLIADLGIERMRIKFVWYADDDIPGYSGTVGLSTTEKDGTTTRIQVACGRGFKEVMTTLAHELRHSWQRFIGIYGSVKRGRTEYLYWKGSSLVPAQSEWRDFDAVKMAKTDFTRYQNQPHEVDARAYADDAWERLFKGHEPKTRLPPRNITDLNELFL